MFFPNSEKVWYIATSDLVLEILKKFNNFWWHYWYSKTDLGV